MTGLKRRTTRATTRGVGLLLVIAATALVGPPHRQPSHAAEPPKLSAEAPQSPRFTSIALSAPTRIDMKRAGVRGDGVTDDSARIQAIIDQAPDNASFYFPAGVYRLASVVIARRSRLEFSGAGADSVLRWSGAGLPRSYTPMMTFREVTDLLIRDLALTTGPSRPTGALSSMPPSAWRSRTRASPIHFVGPRPGPIATPMCSPTVPRLTKT
jgi:hypothetical protein